MLGFTQLLSIGGFDTGANDYYACGTLNEFPGILPGIIHLVILIIKIGIPVLLIIMGMIDLGKSVVAQKEEEIKKAQGLFIKKLIAALLVFLVVFIVQFLVKFITSDKDNDNIKSCINCFVNGEIGGNGCSYNGSAGKNKGGSDND